MLSTLAHIGKKFNDAGILWGIGASILLNHFGLVEKPNDIDILVHIKDIEKADEILKSIGEKKTAKKTDTYSTKYFYEYIVNGFDIDLMSGFKINHSGGVFEYIFDASSITNFKKIDGTEIPLTSLEDWFVIYQLIPGREEKVKLIENYLKSNGIEEPALLKRSLSCNLPPQVRKRTEALLNLKHFKKQMESQRDS